MPDPSPVSSSNSVPRAGRFIALIVVLAGVYFGLARDPGPPAGSTPAAPGARAPAAASLTASQPLPPVAVRPQAVGGNEAARSPASLARDLSYAGAEPEEPGLAADEPAAQAGEDTVTIFALGEPEPLIAPGVNRDEAGASTPGGDGPRPEVRAVPDAPATLPPARPAAPPPPPAATPRPPTLVPPPPPTAAPPPPAPAALSALEQQLFDGHNAERAKAGLPPLRLEGPLQDIARRRAQDMAAKGYFSHTSPTGETAFSLIAAAGVNATIAAENIGFNTYPDTQSALGVLTAFMASPSHRMNILNPKHTRAGVGAATGANGMKYYVVIFAGP